MMLRRHTAPSATRIPSWFLIHMERTTEPESKTPRPKYGGSAGAGENPECNAVSR
jgi:hypothetical protein